MAEEKDPLLDALANLDKRFGKGAVIVGDTVIQTERQSTGSLGVDIITGGGWGKGRMVEIYGPESSGKTTLCIHTMIQAQIDSPDKRVAFIDAEHAFDRNYAEHLGLDMSQVIISQPDCIWEEEYVLTKNGNVKIKDLKIEDLLISVNERELVFQDDMCSDFLQSKKEGFKIRTGNFDLVASKEHRVKTFNGYKKVEDLDTKKDFIEAVYRHNMFSETNLTLLNKDTSFLLGAFLGDGSYKKSSVSFTGIDDILNKKILYTVDKYFTGTTYKKSGICYVFSKKDKSSHNHKKSDLKNFLSSYLGDVSKQDKYVPKAIFESGRENISSFIAGLIMTDGTVEKNGQSVSYSNYIKKVILDVSSLLSFLGIPHKIYTKIKSMPSGLKTCYEISINSKEGLDLFIKNINLISYKKEKLLLADINSKKSFIRFPKDIWKIIFSEIREKGYNLTQFSNIFYNLNIDRHLFNTKRGVSNEFIIRINSVLNSDVLQNMIDSDIYYTHIKEILPTKDKLPMVDITVRNNHNFIANNLLVHNCGEQALEIADALITSGKISVCVIDSVAALTPKSEIEGEMGDSKMGLHARLMSQACRKLTGTVSKTNTVLLWTNQLREKIGVMFGSPEVVPGGNALKFYASTRIDIRKSKGDEDKDGNVINSHVKVKTIKNKLAAPFQVTKFDIVFGEGIDRASEILAIGEEIGIIEKKGSWFNYGETKLGQGGVNVKQLLKDNPELSEEIEFKIRQHFNIQ